MALIEFATEYSEYRWVIGVVKNAITFFIESEKCDDQTWWEVELTADIYDCQWFEFVRGFRINQTLYYSFLNQNPKRDKYKLFERLLPLTPKTPKTTKIILTPPMLAVIKEQKIPDCRISRILANYLY